MHYLRRPPPLLWPLIYALGASSQLSPRGSSTEKTPLTLGNDYHVTRTEGDLAITNGNDTIWSTVSGLQFVSASAGNDSVIGSSGNFNITEVDVDECKSQSITSLQQVPWDGTVTGSAVQVSGNLFECGTGSAQYSLTFWLPSGLPDRVAFYLAITCSTTARPLKKLYFRYASHAGEDFYGLGAQASFASLKNQSVPILSREGGVGRGDQPITAIENANGSFAGGNHFTTYTAIPSYISTDGNVFYLSSKSTGYTNFDFTVPDAVTVRYDSLSVDGAFTQAENMLDAVGRLTAATGRMPALPKWVDTGAILGIQGGQDKVNRIVQQGLNLSCPIAGVWLQDWVGTHSQAGPYLNVSRLWWNW